MSSPSSKRKVSSMYGSSNTSQTLSRRTPTNDFIDEDDGVEASTSTFTWCCGTSSKSNKESQPLLSKAEAVDDTEVSGLSKTYPNKNHSCCSAIFFSWLTPLMELGNRKPLEFEDLYSLNPENRSANIFKKFNKYWNQQLANKKPSMVIALTRAFGGPFFIAGFLKLIHDSMLFVGPIVIKGVIAFLGDPDAPLSEGYFYVAAMLFSGIIQSFCLRQYFFYCYETGMRLRSAVVTAVYHKSLVLSSAARQRSSVGQITNLMSIDAQRLQDLTPFLHGIWYGLFQIVVSTVMLWQQLGPACLGGIAFIIVVIPLTGLLASIMRRLQKNLMLVKDERMKICSEVLSGMKVIKLQGWENSYLNKVLEYRAEELRKLKSYLYTRAGSGTLFNSVPSLVAVISFAIYIMLGNTLEVGVALTSLALFNILRFPLFMLPQVINSVVEASVSFKRLTTFLLEDERYPVSEGDLSSTAIKIVAADFCWDSAPVIDAAAAVDGKTAASEPSDKFNGIQGVTLDVKNGELCAVVGHVGSGKSTLICGMLGDARCSEGEIYSRGSIAYVSQQPFIQNATLKDNILFGKPYDSKKYKKAIFVSALERDLKVLPGGDMTEIGEKGINLSGGQKTRVSIARAVYQDADIYLLDDPLSAVDSHVGRHIFDECIVGALGSKLRVFVTNGLNFLPQCDKIVVLNSGRVAEMGSFDALKKKGGLLSALLSSQETAGTEGREQGAKLTHLDSAETEKFEATSSLSEKERQLSGDNKRDDNESLMTSEDRSTGDVSREVYMVYLNAAGGVCFGLFIFVSYLLSQALTVGSTVWLTYWSENGKSKEHSQMFFLYVFTGLNVAYALSIYLRILLVLSGGLVASQRLFSRLLGRVFRAPMSFFDTTPLGRVVNRLSKDIYTIDESIPSTWNMYGGCVIAVLSTILTICYVTPWFSVLLVPIFIGYYSSQRYFIKTSRELQRLDSISRSPVLALLGETLDGLETIHAYKVENMFFAKNRELLDRNQKAFFLNFSANCWLALRLEFAGTLVAAGAALFAVLSHGTQSALFGGLAGVSLSYAFNVTQTLNWSVRMVSQLQTEMVSVERVQKYAEMDTEAELEIMETKPASDWPQKGSIEFRDVVLRYRPGLPRVLKGLSLVIRAQEKVGIVGRTGAGKSSLIVVLMRLVECDSGSIIIDGINISKIGLHDLRARISIIPQDPVLFSGTVRNNLDPFNKYSDLEIWQSLRRAKLENAVTALDESVSERGANFSVGERQLLCIARALLRKSKIILMDEATASIDVQTDQLIQRSIREEFADCTTLTIAHRLNTIMDSDRVLVMDDGRAVEFDSPMELMSIQNGIFQSLVSESRKQG